MKTRAKCKCCDTLIQIKNNLDIFTCSCGEISLDYIHGTMHAKIKSDYSNMILIDDQGNEIIPKMKENKLEFEKTDISYSTIEQASISESEDGREINISSRRELLSMLDAFGQNIDSLPPSARFSPVTHSDLSSLISLIGALFRSS